jgi:hypothetical protein
MSEPLRCSSLLRASSLPSLYCHRKSLADLALRALDRSGDIGRNNPAANFPGRAWSTGHSATRAKTVNRFIEAFENPLPELKVRGWHNTEFIPASKP